QRFALANHLEIFQQLSLVRKHGGDGFAGSERAAASESNDQVTAKLPGKRDASLHGRNFRFSWHRKSGRLQSLLAQKSTKRLSTAQIAAGHDQRALAKLLCHPANLAYCA